MSKVLPTAPTLPVASDLPTAPEPSAAPVVAPPDVQPAWNGELESLDRAPWFGFIPEEHRPTVREGLTKVRNSMTADYTTKTQAVAAERAQNEQLLQEIASRKEALQALLMGEDDPAAVLEAENAKSRTELQALRSEIEALKAHPAGFVTPEEVEKLRTELQEAVTWRQEVEQAALVASQNALVAEIKDHAGDLAEDDEFQQLVIADLASGRLDSFEDAVPRAVRAARALLDRPEVPKTKVEPDPLPASIATQSVTSGGKLGSGGQTTTKSYAEMMREAETQAQPAWR